MRSPQLPRAPRFRVEGFQAVADTGEAFFSAQVVDLSASGCLVETELQLEVGDTLTLIPNHLDPRLPVELIARVVRTHTEPRKAMAVEFDGMSSEQIERLHSFLIAHGRRAN